MSNLGNVTSAWIPMLHVGWWSMRGSKQQPKQGQGQRLRLGRMLLSQKWRQGQGQDKGGGAWGGVEEGELNPWRCPQSQRSHLRAQTWKSSFYDSGREPNCKTSQNTWCFWGGARRNQILAGKSMKLFGDLGTRDNKGAVRQSQTLNFKFLHKSHWAEYDIAITPKVYYHNTQIHIQIYTSPPGLSGQDSTAKVATKFHSRAF